MKYIKMSIHISTENTENICEYLIGREIEQFSIEGKEVREDVINTKESLRWDFLREDNIEEENIITIYFDENETADVEVLREEMKGLHEVSNIEIEIVNDEDWKDKWKENFKTQKISKTIVVKPSWETLNKCDFNEDVKVIEMDPGMAFGTGTHETTSMCIELLEEYGCERKEILDVGTGTGILAIAAALLGAEHIDAVDIDTDAVSVAKENVTNNKQEDKINVMEGDLTKGLAVKADIVVANLISSLVIYLAKSVKEHMKNDGVFIVSGILIEQKKQVVEELAKEGLVLNNALEKNDWCALAFTIDL